MILSGIYGETNAKEKYSGRDYDTDKSGGPIQNLDWRTANINQAGVDTHTATLEDYKINERNEPLYTPEAIKAAEEQAKREEL
nr:hypothetical protein [Serratia sp. MYb239]